MLQRLRETLKDAVDPNGILSAGPYGVWPRHLRKLGYGDSPTRALSAHRRARIGGVERAARRLRPGRYEHWCAPCHAAGPGHPGTQSLQLKYGGRIPAVLLERTDLSPATVAQFVRQGVLLMAPFRKTEIDDAQLTALADYVARRHRAP